MVRPRGGDFLYTNEEFAVMVEDVKQLIKAGADGIVFGVLTKDGEVDTLRCRDLLDVIKPVPVTFHRAFDMVRDQTEALETIIKLGFDRVLTSGGKSDASQGMKCIKELVEQAEDRIIVMPGGGINENNLEQLLRVTGAKEFHGSARTRVDSEMKYCRSSISMGASGQEYGQMIANVERIKHMVKIAKTLGF